MGKHFSKYVMHVYKVKHTFILSRILEVKNEPLVAVVPCCLCGCGPRTLGLY